MSRRSHVAAPPMFWVVVASLSLTACAAGASRSMSPDGAASGGSCTLAEGCTETTDKCTIVEPAAGSQVTSCVEVTGQVQGGQPCQRNQGGLGHDDCAEGQFCSFIGELPPSAGGTRRCRTLCTTHAQCPGGERCAAIADSGPKAGICGVPCQPFSACAAGMTCSDAFGDIEGGPADFFLVCRVAGPVASGGSCSLHEDCPADHLCFSAATGGATQRCSPMCDDAHPCAAGTCVSAGKVGVCV